MPGSPLVYTPPNYNVINVLYGTGILMTAPPATAMPSDQNLGVASAWISAGWAYVGATEQGVSITFNPKTTDINIEEQPTPVAVPVDTADFQITTSLAEETLTNISLAYGNGGQITVTAAGASQPGKSVLTLSTNFASMAAAIIGKNQLGFARVLSVPGVMSAGQVKTDYRRSASARMYPLTLNAVCNFTQISWTDLTAVATS